MWTFVLSGLAILAVIAAAAWLLGRMGYRD